jgi:mono/diheme cytochrome c family protein
MYIKTIGAAFAAVGLAGAAFAEEISLSKDVMPIFVRSCAVCHKREGGNKGAVKNSRYYEKKEDLLSVVGTFIMPGQPDKSSLTKVLNQSQTIGKKKKVMPPADSKVPKWSEEDLKKFADWVTAGAKDN